MPTAKKARHPQTSKAKLSFLPAAASVAVFRRKVLAFYKKQGRVLPFRQTTDPYAIAVSEFMLQQTQVSRVVPKYDAWLSLFPDWKSLAKASRVSVLKAWSGLGYNRRAIYLHDLAKRVCTDFGGSFPQSEEALLGIAGLGPYTRRAILIFAFNQPLAAVDTNIRRVLISYFSLSAMTPPKDIQVLADHLLPRKQSRVWHYALMDYGAMKLTPRMTGVRPVSSQSKFEGSLREVRGAIVKLLADGTKRTAHALAKETGFSEERCTRALLALASEGIVRQHRKSYSIAE